MKLGIWTPLPHTIPAEPTLDCAIADLRTRGQGAAVDRSYQFAIDVVTAGERHGATTTLIAERWLGPDLSAWMLGTALASHTKNIELMIAVHPGIVAPQVVAKMGASLDRISGGRFAVNIVNGWFQKEFDLFSNGGWIGAEEKRYRRMDEFIRVMKGLWTHDSFSFDGEFYRFDTVSLPLRTLRTPYPTIYAASRTGIGPDVIARDCDVWFVPYEPSHRLYDENARGIEAAVRAMDARARSYGRTMRYGISAHVICRPTTEAAIAAAEALAEYGKKDPVSMVAAKALGAGLLGTPREIAARIRRYEAMGVETFMLHFSPMLEGFQTFAGEVLPLLSPQRSEAAE